MRPKREARATDDELPKARFWEKHSERRRSRARKQSVRAREQNSLSRHRGDRLASVGSRSFEEAQSAPGLKRKLVFG